MLWMFSKNLHVSICLEALPIWEKQKKVKVAISVERDEWIAWRTLLGMTLST